MRKILKDSFRYPFSDWKKFIILGIILFISSVPVRSFGLTSETIILLFVFVGFFTGFFINGYLFRIVKSSIKSFEGLPEFNMWLQMFEDGVKVFAVFLVYIVVPVTLLIVAVILISDFDHSFVFNNFPSMIQTMGINPLEYLTSGIMPAILSIVELNFILFPQLGFIVIILLLVLLPIFFIAIAGMAYDGGEFRSGFMFHDVVADIKDIGLKKLIIWYLVTGVIFSVIFIVSNILNYLLFTLNIFIIGEIVLIILITYSYIFYTRSLGLLYRDDPKE